MLLRALCLVFALLASGTIAAATAPVNLVPNGNFEVDADGNGIPDGWSLPQGATWNADHHLELKSPAPKASTSLHLAVPVQGAEAIRLSFRARWSDVRRGDEPWHDARILLDFKDAEGKTVKGGPSHPYFTGSSQGWELRTLLCLVPEGAVSLNLMPGLYQALSGTLAIDDVMVVAIPASDVPPRQTGTEVAVTVDAGGAPPSALRVAGNKVLNEGGEAVHLQGLNVPSLEWSNTGERLLPAIVEAIDNWRANVIRLPVRDDRWFGRRNDQKDGGAAYRAIIAQAITAAASRGAYLIVDLHNYRAPRSTDVEFWTSFAAAYKDHPAVLFGLLNEPHDITWEVWRDGGDVTEKRKGGDALAENNQALVSFTSPGMQAMVDAVRATGATNIVIVGGLDWAYDLSGITNGFALDDRGGRGIIYDTHVYPWKSGWQKRFLDCAAVHPVLLGEVGCDIQRMSFIPPERHEDPYTWAPDMLACIQANGLHWTAWSFHHSASPRILANAQDFSPSPWWGSFVMAALRGATWTSDRLR